MFKKYYCILIKSNKIFKIFVHCLNLVNEAIVLLIRERAMLVNHPNSYLCTFNNNQNISANNSFVSKYSLELFDAFKELKDDSNIMESYS